MVTVEGAPGSCTMDLTAYNTLYRQDQQAAQVKLVRLTYTSKRMLVALAGT